MMLLLSYYRFLKLAATNNRNSITQTWRHNHQVLWADVRRAKISLTYQMKA